MGKLIVTEFITLDGVIEAPGGGEAFEKGGWAFKFNRGDDGNKFKVDELMAADAQLLGRVTYAGFAKAWPTMNADEFGQKMNSMPSTWSQRRCATRTRRGPTRRLSETTCPVRLRGSNARWPETSSSPAAHSWLGA